MYRSFFFLWAVQAIACTGLLVRSTQGEIVTGRTVEFATHLAMTVAHVPRNFSFTGKTPQGKGLLYRSKYASIGVYCFQDQVLMDGMNEKGLVAAAFYFPGYASYTPLTKENQSKALSPVEFPNWILSQFASIEEIKQALSSIVIVPTIVSGWGNEPPPMHYIVYDRSGKSLVIEPIEGKLVTYDNPIGAFTNSPSFDWHITHLTQYLNLSPFSAKPSTLDGVSLTPFGQGSGMVGLPGDFSPPSRFVRAALFSTLAKPVDDPNALMNQAFHLLNLFDIPLGSVREKVKGITWYDYTQATAIKDPNRSVYAYKTYDNPAVREASFSRFDPNAAAITNIEPLSP